jgi:hypothetical protein
MAFTRRTVAESVGLNHSLATFQELTGDFDLASSARYSCLLKLDCFLRQANCHGSGQQVL